MVLVVLALIKIIFREGWMIAVAILLPWLALMLRGRVFQGLLCLVLQITILGWIPAAIWAVIVVNNDNQERRHRELLDAMHQQQRS